MSPEQPEEQTLEEERQGRSGRMRESFDGLPVLRRVRWGLFARVTHEGGHRQEWPKETKKRTALERERAGEKEEAEPSYESGGMRVVCTMSWLVTEANNQAEDERGSAVSSEKTAQSTCRAAGGNGPRKETAASVLQIGWKSDGQNTQVGNEL